MVKNPNFEVINIQEFDLLLTDINGETIRTMEIDGAKHLSETTTTVLAADPQQTSTLNGIIYGDYSRVLIRALLSVKERCINAIMLVDTASPYTFLTAETLQALQNIDLQHGGDDPQTTAGENQAPFVVLVNGQRTKVHLSKAHFEHVNVLGANFLDFCQVSINYPKRTAQIKIVPV